MIHRVLFIRHGETLDNARGVAQGWSDSSLSPMGERQAMLVAQRLASFGITDLVSSTLPRAAATAGIIAASIGLQPRHSEQFREMHCGSWEGMSFASLRETDPEFHKKWSDDPHVACPGGESFADVRRRISIGLTELREELSARAAQSVVAIVSHGTAIRIAATEMLGLPLSFARQFTQDNTAINEFEWRVDRYVLKRWNDASHCIND